MLKRGIGNATKSEREANVEKSKQSVEALKDVFGLLSGIRESLTLAQAKKVRRRLNECPANRRNAYVKAMRGNSMGAAIKAFCQMCVGWAEVVDQIRNCTDLACPLYPYRPHRAGAKEEAADGTE